MAVSQDRRIAHELATRCPAALQVLLEAYTKAQNRRTEVCNFAVAVQELREVGLAENDLRWLVRRGYAKHVTATAMCEACRALRQERSLPRTTPSGVVLTALGVAWWRELGKDRQQSVPSELPSYDRAARELRVGAQVVKRFRQPASSQEWILLAFQEQEWPSAIDDPLPPRPGRSPKRHLHDTIQNLNRQQRQALLHFSGDGTGQRVCWNWRL